MFNIAETVYEVEYVSTRHHLTSNFYNHMVQYQSEHVWGRYFCGDRSAQGGGVEILRDLLGKRESSQFEILLGVTRPLFTFRTVCIGLSGARARISHGPCDRLGLRTISGSSNHSWQYLVISSAPGGRSCSVLWRDWAAHI
jgi:hypothetical protein